MSSRIPNTASPGSLAPAASARWRWAAPALLAAVGLAVYAGSFNGVFLFDDLTQMNLLAARMRGPWPWPAFGQRWVVEWTLQINYALSGSAVWGYHALNLAIHLLAALTLFGIVRRTLLKCRLPIADCRMMTEKVELTAKGASQKRLSLDSAVIQNHSAIGNLSGEASAKSDRQSAIAFLIALLWLVHPLQTESVTYVIQRAESLMGLFYLLTLYAAIRSFTSPRPLRWQLLSVAACALGMLTKPVMVSAPLSVALYDWLFVSPSLSELRRRSAALYAGLFACWLLLAAAVIANPPSPTAGFATVGVTPLAYLATQPGVLLRYLRLVVWPNPLVLDYRWPLASSAGAIIPPALAVAAMLAITLWGIRRRRPWAFLGFWFFAILAPTSSFMPLGDCYFEHRMYLPLAAPVAAAVLAGYALARRWKAGPAPALAAVAVVAALLATVTWTRNQDYSSAERTWRGVLVTRPANPAAEWFLGQALIKDGRRDEGLAHLRKAIALDPGIADIHCALGVALEKFGETREAETEYREAVRLNPGYAAFHCCLADLLHDQDRYSEAAAEYKETLRCDAALAHAYLGMADTLARLGRFPAAVPFYREYIRRVPEDPAGHYGLAVMLRELGQPTESAAESQQAERLARPDRAAR